MKKTLFILLCIFILGMVLSCLKHIPELRSTKSDETHYINLSKLSENVYVDKNTDVLYYWNPLYGYTVMTPIMKADGTCLTYTEATQRKNVAIGDE